MQPWPPDVAAAQHAGAGRTVFTGPLKQAPPPPKTRLRGFLSAPRRTCVLLHRLFRWATSNDCTITGDALVAQQYRASTSTKVGIWIWPLNCGSRSAQSGMARRLTAQYKNQGQQTSCRKVCVHVFLRLEWFRLRTVPARDSVSKSFVSRREAYDQCCSTARRSNNDTDGLDME